MRLRRQWPAGAIFAMKAAGQTHPRRAPIVMPARPLTLVPTRRWLIAVALAMLVAHEAHELVHTWTGRALCGAWGTRDFNAWSLAPGCTTWIPTLVGPVFSWLVMWAGVALLSSAAEGRRWTGLALIFAPNPLGRLLPALLGGGDEGVVARALVGRVGPWARLLVIATTAVVVLPPLVAAWRTLPIHQRGRWFALLFVGGILVTGPLLFVVGNGLLARGVLAQPGVAGAPLLIDLCSLATLAAFATQWRALANRTRAEAAVG